MKGKSFFIESLKSSEDRKTFVKRFCEQYSYFSQNQIIAFSKILQLLPSDDNSALALIASVIYDELGRGNPSGVHSVLFRNFAYKFGASSLEDTAVVNGVKNYVEQLDEVFDKGPLPAALATYWFLEKSAVETYLPVLSLLNELFPELTENDLEFFLLHTEMEPHHEAAAVEMKDRLLKASEHKIYDDQVNKMSDYWDNFWTDITNYCLDK